jgi:hypothetical protein
MAIIPIVRLEGSMPISRKVLAFFYLDYNLISDYNVSIPRKLSLSSFRDHGFNTKGKRPSLEGKGVATKYCLLY